MNTRSLRFQLIAWYASLLAGVFVVFGCLAFLGLRSYLEGTLRESQLRRARQIGQALLALNGPNAEERLSQEIEERYAPAINNIFVRVTRPDEILLYTSGQPKDLSFAPATLARRKRSARSESVRKELVGPARELLIASYQVPVKGGGKYLVECGASVEAVQAVLHQLLVALAAGLPVVAAVAVGGGYLLVKRALWPVEQIATSAERISSHNLSERLPIPQTGDELERLSLALNRMITRLDEAFQQSRRFLADASHELRTPLTVLRGELEALQQEQTLSAEVRDTVGNLLEEVERLANIVEGLFALSRLEAGEARREWTQFDLAELTASTADQMALLAEDKRISVTCGAGHRVMIEGNRSRLKQVVVNLLDNAIKYTPDGGKVALRVTAAPQRAVLEVIDNGIGIPGEALPHIFERFFRVDKARSRELGGAGLGLAIVRSICTAHGGEVTVESAVGEGSRFKVELPLAGAPSTAI